MGRTKIPPFLASRIIGLALDILRAQCHKKQQCSVGGEGGEITRQFGFIYQVDDVNWPANHLGYLDISLYSADQSGDCVVIPENAQGEETINFSYEIIVLVQAQEFVLSFFVSVSVSQFRVRCLFSRLPLVSFVSYQFFTCYIYLHMVYILVARNLFGQLSSLRKLSLHIQLWVSSFRLWFGHIRLVSVTVFNNVSSLFQ